MKYKDLLIWKIMRFSLCTLVLQFLLISFINAGNLVGQGIQSVREVYIDLEVEHTSIKQVFKLIESKTDYRFNINWPDVNTKKKLDLSYKETSVANILLDVSKATGLNFKQINSSINVLKATDRDKYIEVVIEDIDVSGKVLDAETGEGLPGVNVVIKGSSQGTVTDLDGVYNISVPSEEAILVLSSVGFQTKEVAVGQKTVIDVTMTPDVKSLEQVVVVGYGAVKKRDLTGSVVSVDTETARTGAQVSVDQMIQGRTPGVLVSTTSSEPGGGVSIRIRGTNSITAGNDPLYVIDGLPISNASTPASQLMGSQIQRNPLNALNPGDIESIEILKDASATAIYGSRGANGVILITTKKGSGAMKIDYSSYYGTQSVAKKLELLNAEEYMGFVNDIFVERGDPAPFTSAEISGAGEGTDWQEEIFRTAPVVNQQLSFSGSSQNTSYYASVNYLNQQGVVMSSGIERYSARVNLTHNLNDKFSFGLNLTTSLVKDDFVKNGVGVNAGSGAILSALEMDPSSPVYDSEGSYYLHPSIDVDNPVAIANTWLDDVETNRTFGSLFLEYNILQDLKAKVNFGSDRQLSRRDEFVTKTDTRAGLLSNGNAFIRDQERNSYLAEFTLNYSKKVGDDHSINVLAGYTYQKFNGRGVSASSIDLPTDAYLTNNIAAGDPSRYSIGSDKFQSQLISYLGRINYTLMDKYLLTGSFRVDGSSRFGEGNKYGYFPSVALAWRISDESFMQGLSVLSDLKLRTSYGVTGNQDIGNYQSQLLLSVAGTAVFNDNQFIGISPIQLANPNLKWETTSQWDIGLDIELFDGRVSAVIDYFRKSTYDLLLNLPIPRTSGFTTSLQNVGDTENKGFDFSITTRNLTGDFGWTSSLVGTHVKNKATNLGPLDDIYQGGVRFFNQMTVISVGQPLNSYYGYVVDGIFQSDTEVAASAQPSASPGYLKYRDLNDDGSITVDDRTIIGNPFPDFTLGLNNTFSYKGVELSFFFEGVIGNDMMNLEIANSETPIAPRRNRLAYVLDRWTPDNTGSENPSFSDPNIIRGINSRIIEDASFIRLKNVRLSYNIPIKVFRSLSVFATGQNLLTFTNYRGYDPDVNALGNSSIKVDYSTYPLARIYTVGFNVGF